MPSLVEYMGWAREPGKLRRLKQQWSEACDKGTITCGCGQLRALTHAFRCLYCGEWFCVPCAEKHFGEGIHERLARTRGMTLQERLEERKSSSQECENV
jgi:hypothetical protein